MYKIAIEATQLQSDGNEITQIRIVSANFSQLAVFSLLWIRSSTRPHASDHATLV